MRREIAYQWRNEGGDENQDCGAGGETLLMRRWFEREPRNEEWVLAMEQRLCTLGCSMPRATTWLKMCSQVASARRLARYGRIRMRARLSIMAVRGRAHIVMVKSWPLRFEEARTVFLDPMALTMRDEVHSGDEERLITIGISGAGRLLMIVHTEAYEAPDTVVVRRISSRRAATAERREYEQREE